MHAFLLSLPIALMHTSCDGHGGDFSLILSKWSYGYSYATLSIKWLQLLKFHLVKLAKMTIIIASYNKLNVVFNYTCIKSA